MDECNRLEIGVQVKDPIVCEKLVKQVKEIVRQSFPKEAHSLDLDDNHIRKVLQQWASSRLTSLQQLVEKEFQFLWILPEVIDLNAIDPKINFDKLIDRLNSTEFNVEQLPLVLREFCKEHDIQVNTFMMSIRALLSARKDGPAVHEMMSILGKKTTIERLHRLKSTPKSK